MHRPCKRCEELFEPMFPKEKNCSDCVEIYTLYRRIGKLITQKKEEIQRVKKRKFLSRVQKAGYINVLDKKIKAYHRIAKTMEVYL